MSTPSHLVVLMLENRSFDHMLGFHTRCGGELGQGQGNPLDPADRSSQQIFATDDADYSVVTDARHSLQAAHEQLWGSPQSDTDTDDHPGTPPMNGFISNYRRELIDHGRTGDGRLIMKCHTPDSLRIMSRLAQEYCVCTRWFSSMPGPTWPNRFFVHAATSNGHVGGGPDETLDASVPTLYDRLDAVGIPWRIYSGDFAQAWGIDSLRTRLLTQLGGAINPKAPRTHFANLAQFFADVERGVLPNYVFLEPHYLPTQLWPATDQHPPHDVRFGEDLIRLIYNALLQSSHWEETLFVIIYDEHGGTYDHIPPPNTVNPDGLVSVNPPFNFKRLGARVPAILISPYLDPKVDATEYDHTSVVATANKIFGLGAKGQLTQRDATAKSFDGLLTRATPRPRGAPLPPVPIEASALTKPSGYSDYQLSLLGNTAGMLKRALGLSLRWSGRLTNPE